LISCDKYFYFCVANNTLHYKEQSSLIHDGKIRIEISSPTKYGYISGLVVLKGETRERKKLNSSNTKDELYFDPSKIQPKCQSEVVPATNQEVSVSNAKEEKPQLDDIVAEISNGK
jgi:hypothetical protein